MQGRSLVPLRAATSLSWRTGFTNTTPPGSCRPAKAPERWKYLRWMDARPALEELYDLQADPNEERDLVREPAHADTLATLRARWQSLREALR